jgi:hypothetical protein
LLVAWVCLLILPELYRVSNNLSTLGMSVNGSGVIVDVTAPFSSPSQSPAALAGLHPGDRIDMQKMRCFDVTSPLCRSLITVMGYLGELEYTPPPHARFLVGLSLHQLASTRGIALQTA